jgi:UDP-N-acetylmuramate--alanine ligase
LNFNQINNVYLIGIGGIGMSALARYFHSQGKQVAGYDKIETKLTKELEDEGIKVSYADRGIAVLDEYALQDTQVIYTPAVPDSHGELTAFKDHNYDVIKRAKALGVISKEFETFAVAGTHGKTTTSTILAHVLNSTEEKCNAFIGGIAANYDSNFIINPGSERVVIEADEFDRSFLHLNPKYAIVTSMDSDHLDIYGDGSQLRKSFNDFLNLIKNSGTLILNSDIELSDFDFTTELRVITYGISNSSDYQLHALKYERGVFYFDILGMADIYRNIEFGLPGQYNAENATAVFAICIQLGIPEETIRKAFANFKGVKRRFDFRIRRDDLVVIDDYAHHPTEIEAFLRSVKKLYPEKKLTVIFQPHLFSRTRDFMDAFADSLSIADELYLLPIYPAREEPIPGISSESLLEMINLDDKYLSTKADIVQDITKQENELICILGAGDIDTIVEPIENHFKA